MSNQEIPIFYKHIDYYLSHNGLSLNFNISFSSPDTQAYWGIRDLQLIVQGCHYTCFTCTGPSEANCTKCTIGNYLQGSICLSKCPPNTYGDDNSGICLDCSDSCLECTGPDNDECTLCGNNLTLFNSQCLDECPSEYYSDKSYSNSSLIKKP